MSGPNTNYDPVEVSALSAESVEAALADALAAVEAAGDLDELKAARVAHAGEKSPLALANREIGALPPSAKAEAGKRVGAARGQIGRALAARQEILEAEHEEKMLAEETIDVTVVPERRRIGARHPISLMSERIADIFVGMGWEIADGPEVEAEWFNFDSLNFAPDHPARAMQDTFFVEPADGGLVLRTHTSPVQMRVLHERDLPVYVAVPGKVFRTDDLDATHTPVFHQIEGLAVDKGLTMAHLRGTLDRFLSELVQAEVVTRLRPSFFPFTEPSAEMDVQCWACAGGEASCRVCGGTGWIELGGCGMVNRNVLLAAGIDPEVYTGFAFGLGIERALMLRHGVKDMFDIVEGDVRFSTQFGLEI
ncbi:phenylalanine--tRNA ligase subunit alpha [Dermatophilus congolensis]|uniref:Phenylalanine--tRNA ligase alpha subunit n=1 Tax=Dermatophilus congolensis TaxID=1863 RepID=A0AA46GZW3_9MICO|nr:phenylalanine--tRNA ligase subunit alpha [Dermatophilus congolensis]MBO3142369.1 phenylalanine--tRNA ligase subunit alpha [Dermatophilus congolensis]MBO3151360.1 phenylalanine--tRNA ligase subunit alpha [Dermatophilus congolensis]MBO3161636.1 phenylalanine--tRNA ligase subunit alpha [Dermatophilus congolensis]MBO3162646.1 phenylalanine--tRNA ligase subunit alpha [Dermatophilus congolensis]MBO3176199.1 phenylalanine--tRNA ligase subunit alpha [Dermatophilus congolensis]